MSFKMNSMFLADGYKAGHYNMYKDDLKVIYRDGKFFNQTSLTEIRNRITYE